MIKKAVAASFFAIALAVAALAQTTLGSYADEKGYIDVQKLTCAQLAGTFQEDANMLTHWHGG